MIDKRSKGQYYTRGNPFSLRPFLNWSQEVDLPSRQILEPFAGANNIIKTLQKNKLCSNFSSFDIAPADHQVKQTDTIKYFPQGFDVCVTNPPWLARNSATRRGLVYPDAQYDDLYKHCLELCLNNCRHVAALVPASFLQSGLFLERLSTYILLHDRSMFNDTDNPVCLALFDDRKGDDVRIYYDNEFIGHLHELENSIPEPKQNRCIRFNDPEGELGFVAFDRVLAPSIRFCEVEEISDYPIKVSSRYFTRISGELGNVPMLIHELNEKLEVFRDETQDVFLTPFKGIRKDGRYRRRMDFSMARKLIEAT